jgi:hypothetical protein
MLYLVRAPPSRLIKDLCVWFSNSQRVEYQKSTSSSLVASVLARVTPFVCSALITITTLARLTGRNRQQFRYIGETRNPVPNPSCYQPFISSPSPVDPSPLSLGFRPLLFVIFGPTMVLGRGRVTRPVSRAACASLTFLDSFFKRRGYPGKTSDEILHPVQGWHCAGTLF